MTRDKIRHTAFKALEVLEWLDTHVQARQPKDRRELADKLDDLNKMLLKIIDAPLKTPPSATDEP